MTLGFTESKADSNLYFKVKGGIPMMFLLCVDALFSRYGGVVECNGIFLGQGKYAVEILKRFRMMECMTTPMASNLNLLSDSSSKAVDATMYRQMIGSLMYLTNTRPNICFVVNTLSQFLTDPRQVHLIVAKHILRYLRGTIDYGLKYEVNQEIKPRGLC